MKGYDVVQAENRLHIIIASNESWIVPASGLERRYCVLDVSEDHARDTVYFGAIRSQLQTGGYEAMLHELLHRDLSNFEVREVPPTRALQDQILHSLSPLQTWWYGRLIEGQLLGSCPGWGRATWDDLYDSYVREVGEQHSLNRQGFVANVRALLPASGLQSERPRQGQERQRLYVFPPLAQCRAEWDRRQGIESDWSPDLLSQAA